MLNLDAIYLIAYRVRKWHKFVLWRRPRTNRECRISIGDLTAAAFFNAKNESRNGSATMTPRQASANRRRKKGVRVVDWSKNELF